LQVSYVKTISKQEQYLCKLFSQLEYEEKYLTIMICNAVYVGFLAFLIASLSSLLVTPFPSPSSSSSSSSSYQRRWLRSQTTSLENGIIPRWWVQHLSSYNSCLAV